MSKFVSVETSVLQALVAGFQHTLELLSGLQLTDNTDKQAATDAQAADATDKQAATDAQASAADFKAKLDAANQTVASVQQQLADLQANSPDPLDPALAAQINSLVGTTDPTTTAPAADPTPAAPAADPTPAADPAASAAPAADASAPAPSTTPNA